MAQRRESSHGMLNMENRIIISKSKLKSASATSALMAGFALTAFVDLDVPRSHVDGQMFALQDNGVVIAYGAVTSLVVVVHMLALMISTCIIPLVR